MKHKHMDTKLVSAIEKYAYPLNNTLREYDPIIDAAKNKQFVLLGEASHGTLEFYRTRSQLTQRLIYEQGFDALLVEADWPDAYRVNRYVCGQHIDTCAIDALNDFERFPTWMWRNTEVHQFIKWLYSFNNELTKLANNRIHPVGFYGLDLYSMHSSIQSVIDYLQKIDPHAASHARTRYACLDHFMNNPQAYGYAHETGSITSCRKQITDQLTELYKHSSDYIEQDGPTAEDDHFCALRNAQLIKNAQTYYRSMFKGQPSSWNQRDQHMFETVKSVSEYLSQRMGREAKIVVWAHNSHVGNASATDMAKRGEFNIGQLVRTEFGDKSLLVGFSTCQGTVTAASNWDTPQEYKRIQKPWPGSYEEIFHRVNHKQFGLNLREENEMVDLLMQPRLQRAIGVIYRPDTERFSHYFNSCLPQQFDFMLHYDETRAIRPLNNLPHWHLGEADKTYPTGL